MYVWPKTDAIHRICTHQCLSSITAEVTASFPSNITNKSRVSSNFFFQIIKQIKSGWFLHRICQLHNLYRFTILFFLSFSNFFLRPIVDTCWGDFFSIVNSQFSDIRKSMKESLHIDHAMTVHAIFSSHCCFFFQHFPLKHQQHNHNT